MDVESGSGSVVEEIGVFGADYEGVDVSGVSPWAGYCE